MAAIRGIDVTLYEKTVTGVDEFNNERYEEVPVVIHNVLVAPASAQETLDSHNLYGKKAIYTLAIPKGDEHEWEDVRVSFFGKDWKTFGIPLEGIECDIPLDWNKKVTVDRYE